MKTVFFDVDTQIDFVYPAGALYVPGAEGILPNVASLNRHAAEHGFPVISTTDAHREADPEFEQWTPHCVAGTLGQRKPELTLLPLRTVVPVAPGSFSVAGAEQVVLQKQKLDCFSNPNLPTILDELAADRYVVYGVVTEFCVRCAALGALARGGKVELVTDAVKSLGAEAEAKTMEEIREAGGRFVTTAEVMSR